MIGTAGWRLKSQPSDDVCFCESNIWLIWLLCMPARPTYKYVDPVFVSAELTGAVN